MQRIVIGPGCVCPAGLAGQYPVCNDDDAERRAMAAPDRRDLLSDLLALAQKAGADAADAILAEGTSLSLGQRLRQPEKLERSESTDLGLRVFVGQRMALVSTADLRPAKFAELVDRAVAMARAVPEDPYCGLAPSESLAKDWPDLDLFDPGEPAAEVLVERARTAEAAALDVPGITNSEGAEAGWSRSVVTIAGTNGFAGHYARSSHQLSVAVIAGGADQMEIDYDYTSKAHESDLDDAAAIGRRAGERAVKRLGATKIATGQMPVVFDERMAGSLLRNLAGAISGPAIARGTSFLKDRLNQAVFASGIRVVDEPQIKRGLRSRPFDGEGVGSHRRAIIDDGVLTTWFLDLRSARQLGLASTGHASRGTGSPPSPSPSNLFLEPGSLSPEALIADIKTGFYVTAMMGMGVNQVTGDYSRGASGFRIVDGAIGEPVNEVTVAGNLNDMFRSLVPANDLVFKTGIDSPTVRIEGMTVAGA